MDQNELDLKTLDHAQYLLERMLELAERSAGDDCGDAERARLQKILEVLRGLLEETMEQYRRTGASGSGDPPEKPDVFI